MQKIMPSNLLWPISSYFLIVFSSLVAMPEWSNNLPVALLVKKFLNFWKKNTIVSSPSIICENVGCLGGLDIVQHCSNDCS